MAGEWIAVLVDSVHANTTQASGETQEREHGPAPP